MQNSTVLLGDAQRRFMYLPRSVANTTHSANAGKIVVPEVDKTSER